MLLAKGDRRLLLYKIVSAKYDEDGQEKGWYDGADDDEGGQNSKKADDPSSKHLKNKTGCEANGVMD